MPNDTEQPSIQFQLIDEPEPDADARNSHNIHTWYGIVWYGMA